ncbi:mechanosensitive ion channel family protein [Salinirubellus salinus]|uniref:Mechanosensitive ion channel family protein n=1 Tax=Salinirubellus salinus TaxID=1364945 RepID=A0A9E7R652_9EURY|nr:mechanosensitive ion channel family protein [Salinirubellus salinus]UWM55418.1 mechanosensitive ion channel family protein [Salinirubellus salinus]
MNPPTPVPLQNAITLVDTVAEFLNGIGVPPGIADAIAAAVVFLVAFVVIYAAGKALISPLFDRVLERRDLDEHARRPLRRIVSIIVVFVAISAAFGLAGFGNFLQSLATVAAAATLAIGFAMQDVLKNFVAGVFIYTDKPFRIGDWIEWDGNAGIVEDISLRVSRVRTFDNELLTVPNSQLTDGVIKNPVAKDKLRLKFVFGIGYDDDIDTATDIIVEEAEQHDEILDDPAPSVRLTELADSYVGLQSRIWIANPSRADWVRTRAEYVKNVKQRFDAEGIEIPFPQRDLSGDVSIAAPAELVGVRADDD